jgi:hypothetical protein
MADSFLKTASPFQVFEITGTGVSLILIFAQRTGTDGSLVFEII